MEEYVECRICGFKSKRIYGRHLKSHGITSEEYKKLYPDAPLYAECDGKNTAKNSGKHMKTEKYKRIFSEKIKGDKNPTNTTGFSARFSGYGYPPDTFYAIGDSIYLWSSTETTTGKVIQITLGYSGRTIGVNNFNADRINAIRLIKDKS